MENVWRVNSSWEKVGGEPHREARAPVLPAIPRIDVRALPGATSFMHEGRRVEPGAIVSVSETDLPHLLKAGKCEIF